MTLGRNPISFPQTSSFLQTAYLPMCLEVFPELSVVVQASNLALGRWGQEDRF